MMGDKSCQLDTASVKCMLGSLHMYQNFSLQINQRQIE